MGSPITFSGFNQIDFSVVLNAIMQQESQPLQSLQTQQTALQATDSSFAQLASKLDALHAAASDLSDPLGVATMTATSSDSAAVTVSASSGAVAGHYDVVVNELARAQVTASSTTAPDIDTTTVASGGTLTIGGAQVTVTGPVTLAQLVAQINSTANIPVSASIVETSPGAFRLVLTSRDSGAIHAFTVVNALTGGTIAFTDTNGDGASGDTAADNAVQATDASVLINNILVTSASNTLDSGVPGVTVTLNQKDATKTIAVTVGPDDQSVVDRVQKFVTAYNDLVAFADSQATSAGQGTPGSLGHNSLLRTLRGALRNALSSAYGTGTITRLAEIGLAFNRKGQLTLDQKMLAAAYQSDRVTVETLFANPTSGAFAAIDAVITEYTRAGGLVPDARSKVSDELTRLGQRIDEMQARLALRRAALQQEFIAADQAMSRLNSQSASLAQMSTNLVGGSF